MGLQRGIDGSEPIRAEAAGRFEVRPSVARTGTLGTGTLSCPDCDAPYDLKDLRTDDDVPSCVDCGGNLRPDVVLFGEMLPPGAFERAAEGREQPELVEAPEPRW